MPAPILGLRDRTMLEMMYASRMRVSELAGLELAMAAADGRPRQACCNIARKLRFVLDPHLVPGGALYN